MTTDEKKETQSTHTQIHFFVSSTANLLWNVFTRALARVNKSPKVIRAKNKKA